jgi:hypothetical protein
MLELPKSTDPGSAMKWVRGALIATVLGVLLHSLAIVFVEDFAKPGVSSLSRGAFNLATKVSHTLRDEAYVGAALDSSQVPGLIGLTIASLLPLFVGLSIIASEFVAPRLFRSLDNKKDQLKAAEKEGSERVLEIRTELKKQRRKWSLIAGAYGVVLGLVVLRGSLVVNEAIYVRRVFSCNLARLGPVLTERDRLSLQASFASMASRTDYDRLAEIMRGLARHDRVNLVDIDDPDRGFERNRSINP